MCEMKFNTKKFLYLKNTKKIANLLLKLYIFKPSLRLKTFLYSFRHISSKITDLSVLNVEITMAVLTTYAYTKI